MKEILFDIMELVVIIAAFLIARYVLPYIRQLLRSHNYTFAEEIIDILVRYAEQKFQGSGRGEEKLAEVIGLARESLAKYNIKLTDEQIKELIESAVLTMNNEFTSGAAA